MLEKYLEFIKKAPWIALVAGSLFILGTFIIMYFENVYAKLDYLPFLTLLGFIFGIYLCLLFATRAMVNVVLSSGDKILADKMQKTLSHFTTLNRDLTALDEEIKSRKNTVSFHLDGFLSKIKQFEFASEELKSLRDEKKIINNQELAEIEEDMDIGNNIWVLSSYLKTESLPDFRDAIINNILQGVRYTYLIPDNRVSELEKHINTWVKMCLEKDENASDKELRERVRYVVIPKHFCYVTVLIYAAESDTPEVVVKFPYRGKKAYENWMFRLKSDDPDAIRIKNSLDELVKSHPDLVIGQPHCQRTYDRNKMLSEKKIEVKK